MKLLAIATFLLAATADLTCTLSHKDGGKDRTLNVNEKTAATGCRGISESDYGKVDFDASKMKLEFFDSYGCGSKPHTVLEQPGELPADKDTKSCRLVPIQNTTIAAAPPSYGSYEGISLNNQTAFDDSHVYAAVLYEDKDYHGIKHWIDGTVKQYDNCRGLSGVNIASVKMVNGPGADPDTNAAAVDDSVTMVFFEDWGCKGKVVGAVTGTQPELCNALSDGSSYSDLGKRAYSAYHGGPVSAPAVGFSSNYPDSTHSAPVAAEAYPAAPVAAPTAAPVAAATYTAPPAAYAAPTNATDAVNATAIAPPAAPKDGCIKNCAIQAKSVMFVKTGTPNNQYGTTSTAGANAKIMSYLAVAAGISAGAINLLN